eukprot:GGOE01063317.1.p1 GENE.GGOE01063317.1~~GGOE01063317.1.p1  ORF type:complete len:292 (+),score=43.48 GGOE01063317.1:49-876(+)
MKPNDSMKRVQINLQKLTGRISQKHAIYFAAVVCFLTWVWFGGLWPFYRKRMRGTIVDYGRPREVEWTIFSIQELSQFDGSKAGQPLLISILGDVYDVTAGAKYYGGSTKFATVLGRDATAAFATGRFNLGALDADISSLTSEHITEVFSWREFFETQKKYPKVGVLSDRYYNGMGWATPKLRHLEQLHEGALQERENIIQEYDRYEACQSLANEGSAPHSVACPAKSYVRELTSIRPDGRQVRRCVCMREDQLQDPSLNMYPSCGSSAEHCELL